MNEGISKVTRCKIHTQESTALQTAVCCENAPRYGLHCITDRRVLRECTALRTPLHYRLLCASNIWILRLKPAKARSVSRPHQNKNFGAVEDPVRRMKRGATDGEKHLQSTHQTKGCDLEYRRYSDSTPQS